MNQLTANALQAAYTGNWKLSIDLNKQILQQDSHNIEALNRIAKAFMEQNQPTKALEYYKKVTKLDHYNTIAKKNIKRLTNVVNPKTSTSANTPNHTTPQVSFIEEPGVTKTVQLSHSCERKILAKTDAGDPVIILPKTRHICITNESKQHLGKLPEDLSLRLINLIKCGNQYQAWVKAVDNQSIKIFIKETYRAPKFKNIPSFSESNHTAYLAFTDPSSAYPDRPDTSSIDEDLE